MDFILFLNYCSFAYKAKFQDVLEIKKRELIMSLPRASDSSDYEEIGYYDVKVVHYHLKFISATVYLSYNNINF